MMNEVLIIIVVYKKKIIDLSLINDLLGSSQKIDILIYDNSPNKQISPSLKNVNLYYIHDKNNPGVSKGYNTGIDKAKELGKKYILLLDQDTLFSINHLDEYIKLIQIYQEQYIYAPIVAKEDKIYSPFIEKNFVGQVQYAYNFNYNILYNLDNKSVINSGLMIPIKIIDQVGYFNEKIKLDFSDIYFIEKYKKLKKEIVLANTKLTHSLSGDEGKNYDAEIHRFKYYCNGAKEFSKSSSQSTFWSVTRRMLRLVQKYYSLKPIDIYINYYLGNKKI